MRQFMIILVQEMIHVAIMFLAFLLDFGLLVSIIFIGIALYELTKSLFFKLFFNNLLHKSVEEYRKNNTNI